MVMMAGGAKSRDSGSAAMARLAPTAVRGRLVWDHGRWVIGLGRRKVPAPWVRELRLRDLAPNWRVGQHGQVRFVEVPRWWKDEVRDPDVRRAIEELTEGLETEPIYGEGVAEALDDHRRVYPGYRVPLAAWDERMAQIVGVTWDERLVGRRELAELLGISPKTVDFWRRQPGFPTAVSVGGSGRADGRGGRSSPRWSLTAVLSWLGR